MPLHWAWLSWHGIMVALSGSSGGIRGTRKSSRAPSNAAQAIIGTLKRHACLRFA